MRRIAILTLGLILAFLVPASGQPQFKHGILTITQDGRRVVVQVEVADTPAARAQGLMFRAHLDEQAGMLFIFETESRWAFWMKNTLIPLTIGYFDADWQLVGSRDMKVAPDPEKGPFEIYQPEQSFKYGLEVNQCFFKRHSLRPGARATLTLTQGAAPR
ncbi:MAG TPA: DUF192 domain-containing protein, partial [bacterium]